MRYTNGALEWTEILCVTLRRSRETAGLSVAQAAKRTGYSQNTIWNWERTGKGSAPHVLDYLEKLGCRVHIRPQHMTLHSDA